MTHPSAEDDDNDSDAPFFLETIDYRVRKRDDVKRGRPIGGDGDLRTLERPQFEDSARLLRFLKWTA